jgi:hypothetical protein
VLAWSASLGFPYLFLFSNPLCAVGHDALCVVRHRLATCYRCSLISLDVFFTIGD